MNEDSAQPKKIGSIRRSWLITKSTWRIFKLDKEVTLVPLISGFVGIIVGVIGFGGGFLLSNNLHNVTTQYKNSVMQPQTTSSGFNASHTTEAIWLFTALILAILSAYTLAAMIGIGLKRLRGGDPTLRDGLAAIRKNFVSLTVFAAFSFGVIQLLQFIQSRVPFIGKVLTFLGEIAWSVASFFAIPIIVDSDKALGPIDATKESLALIRRTWKESGANQFILGSIVMFVILFELFAGAAVAGALWSVSTGAAIVGGAIAIGAILLTILVTSALEGIAKAVLYHYALTGEAPAEFDKRLLQEAFTAKKARKIFG